MTDKEEIAYLRAQLRLSGVMMGQIFGIIALDRPIKDEEIETFCATFSTGNGFNNEFMDSFREGLDKMVALRRQEEGPQFPAPSRG